MNTVDQQAQSAQQNLPKPPAWFAERFGVQPVPAEFKFECPQCGQHFKAGIELAGRKLECPECMMKFIVPNP